MLASFHVASHVVALGLVAVRVTSLEPIERWSDWTGRPAEPDFTPTTSCPIGYYQDAPIVFNCAGSGGEHEIKVLLTPNQEIGIPKGTSDLKVSVQADAFDGDLDIYDPIAGVWVKDHLTRQGLRWEGTYKHVQTYLETTKGMPTKEEVHFQGPLPTVLILHLKSYNAPATGAEFRIKYSYGASAESDCVKTAAVGCRNYDEFATRETTLQWSRWASEQYPSSGAAWTALASGHAIGDIVPAHRWCGLWNAWPAAAKQAAGCEAVLKLVAGSSEKIGVEREQFDWAYSLDKIATYHSRCCSAVRMAYADEASAWSALQAPDALWRVCSASAHHEVEVPQKSWLAFMDVNGKRGIQAEEFHQCWMSAEECPRYTYYRTQVVLFRCRPEKGRAGLLLPPGETQEVAEVPEGLVDLQLGVEAALGSKLDIVLRDAQAASNTYTVRAGSVKHKDPFQGTTLLSRGSNTTYKLQESIAFRDDTPTPLMLGLTGDGWGQMEVKVNFSYDGFRECPSSPESDEPDVPVGCAFYNAREGIPQACLEFSDFLQQEHPDEESFWRSVHDGHVQKTAVGEGIPFFMWRSLWTSWPGGAARRSWQECFHWFDTNHDGYLMAREVEQLYGYSRTNAVSAGYCGALCHTYPNQKALWAAWSDGALTIAPHRWALLWNAGKPQVNALEAFHYMDKDGSGAIDHEEFQVCYNLGSCKHNWPLIGGLLSGAGAAVGAAASAAGSALTSKQWLHTADRNQDDGFLLVHTDDIHDDDFRTRNADLQAVARQGDPGPSGVAAWIWIIVSVMGGCILIVCVGLSLVPFFVRKQTRPTRPIHGPTSSSTSPPAWMQQMPSHASPPEPAATEPSTEPAWGNYTSEPLSPLPLQAAVPVVEQMPVQPPEATTTVLRPIQPPPPSTLPSVQPLTAPHQRENV